MSAAFARMRQVAMREWKIAPPVFDDMMAEGRISMTDVIELIFMLMQDPLQAWWLGGYLWPDKMAKEKAKSEAEKAAAERAERERRWRITGLQMLTMCKPKNEDEKQRIEAMKEDLKSEH